MTDLEKKADEYAIKVAEKNGMPKDCFAEHLIRLTYLDATKAETAILSQHILDLQKDKGNLTDKVKELEQFIKTQDRKLRQQSKECDKAIDRVEILVKKNADLEAENEQIKNSDTLCKIIGEQKRKIAELEAQIEKMKAELHHRLISPSHDDSDCLDKIVGLDRLWQFGQEF